MATKNKGVHKGPGLKGGFMVILSYGALVEEMRLDIW